jgi:NitT/TauT family transport system permease protein
MSKEETITATLPAELTPREIPAAIATLPAEQPLPLIERLWRLGAVRKGLVLALLLFLWQLYAVRLDNRLLVPTFTDTFRAFVAGFAEGELLPRIGVSLKILLAGYAVGVVLAGVLTILAVTSRFGCDLLESLTAMFNPLPAIALLPLALLWFGLGSGSIIFVIIHAVLWPISLNAHAGFTGVSATIRMVGRNYGLRGPAYVFRILIPAALPSILTGLKIGWAFAWRTLIAAELVFGVSSGSGGLGWFIYEKKNQLETASVFAGLGTVILIGILVENAVFRTLEARTVGKWGMKF